MEDVFRFADELGPAKIVHVYQPSLNLKAILAVDNVAMGPSIGGLRIAPDVSSEECFRLARAMTLKNAAAGLRHGGGKAVLYGDPKMPKSEKEPRIRALACALSDMGEYIFGPDMGTDEECMAWVHDEMGRAVGLPREIGGIPLDEIGATGFGLAVALGVAEEFSDMRIKGARVAVQGFGAVGKHAARFLGAKGARLVAASDTRGCIYNPDGIDVGSLIEFKDAGRSVAQYPDGKALDADALLDIECDIWIPAARPDVLTIESAKRLKARVVAEGANIPATPEAERLLAERGVLVLPDFIANAGGVICAAMELNNFTETQAMQVIEEKIRSNVREVLRAARTRGKLPRDAALELAESRVRTAMSFRQTH